MLWIVKGLFLLGRSRRGRELLWAAGLGMIELAQGEQARKLYAKARTAATDPTVRQKLTRNARRAAQAIPRRR